MKEMFIGIVLGLMVGLVNRAVTLLESKVIDLQPSRQEIALAFQQRDKVLTDIATEIKAIRQAGAQVSKGETKK